VVNATEPSGVVGGYEVAMRASVRYGKHLPRPVPEKIMAAVRSHCHAGLEGMIRFGKSLCLPGNYRRRHSEEKGKDGIDGCQADLSILKMLPLKNGE